MSCAAHFTLFNRDIRSGCTVSLHCFDDVRYIVEFCGISLGSRLFVSGQIIPFKNDNPQPFEQVYFLGFACTSPNHEGPKVSI